MGDQISFHGGAKYTAVQQDNGNWTVKDVPIFIEHTYDDGEVFDKKWMANAVSKSLKRLQQDGYRAPLHANHHKPGEKTERIGEFVPTRIAPMTYEGRKVNAIYADFVNINPENYERIKRGEFPYRSVEIPNDKPEIVSLALLSDKVPYFRFGNLEIGKEVGKEMAMFSDESTDNPEIIFNFTGDEAMTQSKKGKLPKDDEEALKVREADSGKDDDNKKDEEGKQMQAEGGDKLDMLIEMVKQLLSAVAGKAAETPKEEAAAEAAPVQMEAKIAGLITSYEARIKGLEAKSESNDRVAQAKTQLQGYLYDEASLAKYAGNKEALDTFVATVKQYGAKDTVTLILGTPSKTKREEPKEVTCYEAEGPVRLAKARKFNRMYEDLVLANPSFGQTVTREAFIKDQFDCDAMIGVAEEGEE